MRRTILFVICCVLGAEIHAAAPNLSTVLDRAQKYVAAYEEQLGTLVGVEDYEQTAVWDNGPVRTRYQKRRLSSDFLLMRVGGAWFGVREVLRVDLKPIEEKQTDFRRILGNDPGSLAEQFREINRSNSRYNIGDFVRTFNVPTFPLTILRRENFKRFTFKRRSLKNIENVATLEIEFSETAHPTMIRDLTGKDQQQHGRLWVDPETGRVLKTETLINANMGGTRVRVSFVVTYKMSPRLNVLAPDTMQENYDTDRHHVIGSATYSNFRRFETEVKIGPIQQ